MTKNVYDLLVGLAAVVDGLASTLSIYFFSIGKIDGKTAGVIADTTVAVTGLVLGVCSRYITDKPVEKK